MLAQSGRWFGWKMLELGDFVNYVNIGENINFKLFWKLSVAFLTKRRQVSQH